MRLIDVHELDILGHLEEFPECESDKAWNAAVREICTYVDLAPTVDAVPVVRCKDCANGMMSDDGKYIICCTLGVGMEFDDFCSYGERKDEANEP